MISEERRKSGSDSRIVSYREKVIGDPSKERDRLEAISPVNFADQFQAPASNPGVTRAPRRGAIPEASDQAFLGPGVSHAAKDMPFEATTIGQATKQTLQGSPHPLPTL